MVKAILLSIHSIDVAGAILTVVWLLAIVIVMLLDYGFKHGWFIPRESEGQAPGSGTAGASPSD